MRTCTKMLIAVLLLAGCAGQSTEQRAREAEKKIKESIPNIEAKALAQPASADAVREAQAALSKTSEYQGEVNGKLDTVTVNAIEAFQRAHDLKDDGILDEPTRHALQAVLAQK